MTKPIIILDPGHGLGNRRAGIYDPGAGGFGDTEAAIVMEWANRIRAILRSKGFPVVRTRVDRNDPCPVSKRAQIARDYRGTIMLSIHCNAADGKAQGTETFYRGSEHKPFAEKLTAAVCQALGTKNRGAKTEQDSQHSTLAVMAFQPCFLLELGFIDNIQDHNRIAPEITGAGRTFKREFTTPRPIPRPPKQIVYSATTMTPDMSLGSTFYTTLTGTPSTGIAAPLNPLPWEELTLVFVQGGSGSYTCPFNAIFEFGGVTATWQTAVNATNIMRAVYNPLTAKWIVTQWR